MYTIRFAQPGEETTIMQLVNELADYENALDEVKATPEMLAEWLFQRAKGPECLLLAEDGRDVGMALFFHNFSTWLGKGGIYLEDLFVKPECRGKGYGQALLRQLARIALERGCGRVEWACLNWNEPSIGFYKSLGAQPMSEWTTYRLTGETLQAMADRIIEQE